MQIRQKTIINQFLVTRSEQIYNEAILGGGTHFPSQNFKSACFSHFEEELIQGVTNQ